MKQRDLPLVPTRLPAFIEGRAYRIGFWLEGYLSEVLIQTVLPREYSSLRERYESGKAAAKQEENTRKSKVLRR